MSHNEACLPTVLCSLPSGNLRLLHRLRECALIHGLTEDRKSKCCANLPICNWNSSYASPSTGQMHMHWRVSVRSRCWLRHVALACNICNTPSLQHATRYTTHCNRNPVPNAHTANDAPIDHKTTIHNRRKKEHE